GSHAYREEGSYALHVTINDRGGSTTAADGSVTVADAALTASGASVTAREGSAFSGVVATFGDANPFATAGGFSATVAWGDGTTSAGAVSADGSGGFQVTGSHTYADEGNYAVQVTIYDVGGASTLAASTAAVADAPLTSSGVA